MSAPAMRRASIAILATGAIAMARAEADTRHPWLGTRQAAAVIENTVPPPPGFVRVLAERASFAGWLRDLPMKDAAASVHLFDGRLKARQDVHAGVLDIDTGPRDLQQCADAVMRLRAEWQYYAGQKDKIAFNFSSGKRAGFARYAKGERPNSSGTNWSAKAKPDGSYGAFRAYMNLVFAFAGTASLENELKPVAIGDLRIGDVFIKGGFPGHAVLVADMIEHPQTRQKRFLLVQSYMPAQDIHILKNPADAGGSPWYAVPEVALVTPEWTFAPGSLRRWPGQ
jgi:hypothetical protein